MGLVRGMIENIFRHLFPHHEILCIKMFHILIPSRTATVVGWGWADRGIQERFTFTKWRWSSKINKEYDAQDDY